MPNSVLLHLLQLLNECNLAPRSRYSNMHALEIYYKLVARAGSCSRFTVYLYDTVATAAPFPSPITKGNPVPGFVSARNETYLRSYSDDIKMDESTCFQANFLLPS